MITRYQHLVMQRSDTDEISSDLAPVEALIGTPLPQDVADFLIAANGRLISYDLVISKGKKKKRVLPFHLILELGVERSKRYPTTIVAHTKTARQFGAPNSFIQFGYHTSMVLLFYDVPPRGTGRVLASITDGGKFTPVAESFDEYIRGLTLNYERTYDWVKMVAAGGDPRGMREMRDWVDAAVPDWRTRWEVPDDFLADSP
jgi:hypothetical protein